MSSADKGGKRKGVTDMSNKLRRSEKGFTLVELLVVIAIIAVLATIILPGMGNIKYKANVLKCSKNLSGLYS